MVGWDAVYNSVVVARAMRSESRFAGNLETNTAARHYTSMLGNVSAHDATVAYLFCGSTSSPVSQCGSAKKTSIVVKVLQVS